MDGATASKWFMAGLSNVIRLGALQSNPVDVDGVKIPSD